MCVTFGADAYPLPSPKHISRAHNELHATRLSTRIVSIRMTTQASTIANTSCCAHVVVRRSASRRVAPSTSGRRAHITINDTTLIPNHLFCRATTTATKWGSASSSSSRGTATLTRVYPDADYVAKVQTLFPAKGTATAEEGRRVLFVI